MMMKTQPKKKVKRSSNITYEETQFTKEGERLMKNKNECECESEVEK